MSREEIQSHLGARISTDFNNIPKVSYRHLLESIAIPAQFDLRTQWPDCIHEIRDQQSCGSGWAFGTSEAFSDRLCIATNGKKNIILSPQYSISCDFNNHACEGGYVDKAWQFLKRNGIPSDACIPYTAGAGNSRSCLDKCADGSFQILHIISDVITYKTVMDAKIDIVANGPVVAVFDVYEDFISYASGIYSHTQGRFLDLHAVKIVGWGQENFTSYWIAANSWGNDWGEEGFFRIQEGECGIDIYLIAGIPSI
eukprot:TRINITY_DN3640_c0_g1_i6.p1 TRINITY_DN3640_c0_g1~~TRINITY_DN3640_c0_g1_i6.p1  ORF type:complete len:255 (-),score=46.92 TRINITY_DN3640_c0_g1_i6:108-872(-)